MWKSCPDEWGKPFSAGNRGSEEFYGSEDCGVSDLDRDEGKSRGRDPVSVKGTGLGFVVHFEKDTLFLVFSEREKDARADPEGKSQSTDADVVAVGGNVECRSESHFHVGDEGHGFTVYHDGEPPSVVEIVLDAEQERKVCQVSEGVDGHACGQNQIRKNGVTRFEPYKKTGSRLGVSDGAGHVRTYRRDESDVGVEQKLVGTGERIDRFGRGIVAAC